MKNIAKDRRLYFNLPFKIIIFLLMFFVNSNAEENYLPKLKIPHELKDYSKAYLDAQRSTRHQSIEEIYKLGKKSTELLFDNNEEVLQQVLMDEGEVITVNSLTEFKEGNISKEFRELMVQLVPGYDISKGASTIYCDVDAKEFLELAKNHGTERDIKFFELYKESFPSGETWPIYVMQRSEFGGCVKYGDKEYIDFYKNWKMFIETYSDGYYSEIAKSYINYLPLDDICSCNSKESTILGLEELAKIISNIKKKEIIESEIKKRKLDPISPYYSNYKLYNYDDVACGG